MLALVLVLVLLSLHGGCCLGHGGLQLFHTAHKSFGFYLKSCPLPHGTL